MLILIRTQDQQDQETLEAIQGVEAIAAEYLAVAQYRRALAGYDGIIPIDDVLLWYHHVTYPNTQTRNLPDQ